MTQPKNSSYEIIVQEDKETGDLLLPLPQELLDEMGWKEGDNLEWTEGENGSFILQKV